MSMCSVAGISHKAWYLFNDFAVSNTSPVSAVAYNTQWKLPVILYYAHVDLNRKYTCTPKVRSTVVLCGVSLSSTRVL